MDDTGTIGQRVARARKLRDLNQEQLAARMHVSKSLVTQVERGHKPATQAFVTAAANSLNVDSTELTGQPYRGRTAASDRIHAAIPEIRQAVAYWDIAPEMDLSPRPLAELAADIERAGQLRMEASYVQLGALLPGLIKELAAHVHQLTGPDQAQTFRLLAEAYTAVDSMAYKLGYMDLFALAVERVAWAAAQADDPLLRPVAAMRRSSVFLATGGWDGGITLLARAGREVDQGQGDDATLSVYGTMHLRSAILAARANRPSSAWDSIGHAAEVSERLGHDTKDYGLLFGPTNVAIHGVAVAVELGDADEAVRRGSDLELPEDLPRERSSHHFIDLSRAWLWQGRPDKALACVTKAERLAPQRTRYHPMARQTVTQLLDHRRQLPEPLRGVATRMGLS
ncbi:MAG: helix-turn-helix domain-containing protein [Streptosporangiaceae bacterium]|jgi:transcriptional regulator with XRE-family HTH domain